jgi:hypothetical protein
VNPFGLLIISIGIITFIIGLKGTQHNVIADFKGAHTTASTLKAGPAT